MKIKNNFLLKEVAGSYMVIPVGSELVDMNCMITLNESGAFLWQSLSNETTKEQVLEAMLKEYDVDKETAMADIEEFMENLRSIGALDE